MQALPKTSSRKVFISGVGISPRRLNISLATTIYNQQRHLSRLSPTTSLCLSFAIGVFKRLELVRPPVTPRQWGLIRTNGQVWISMRPLPLWSVVTETSCQGTKCHGPELSQGSREVSRLTRIKKSLKRECRKSWAKINQKRQKKRSVSITGSKMTHQVLRNLIWREWTPSTFRSKVLRFTMKTTSGARCIFSISIRLSKMSSWNINYSSKTDLRSQS